MHDSIPVEKLSSKTSSNLEGQKVLQESLFAPESLKAFRDTNVFSLAKCELPNLEIKNASAKSGLREKLEGLTREARQKKEIERLKKENWEAARAIQNIEKTTTKAAKEGKTSVEVLRVGNSIFEVDEEKPPKLSKAEQKVFDHLKKKGLDPKIELIEDPELDFESYWAITANWK